MFKKILAITITMYLTLGLAAQESEHSSSCVSVTYGLEWSFVGTFASYVHQNFYSAEGSRVDLEGSNYFFKPEAELYAHVGADIGEFWNVSLYAGYTKIAHLIYAIPVSVRATRSFNAAITSDKWLTFIEAGTGAALKHSPTPIFQTRLGFGYRFALSKKAAVDLLASYKLTYLKPHVKYFGESVPSESVRRNNAFFSAFTIGIGITL